MQAEATERVAITKETIIEMLLADRGLAREKTQAGASIAIARLMLHGMFIERKEQGRPGDFAG